MSRSSRTFVSIAFLQSLLFLGIEASVQLQAGGTPGSRMQIIAHAAALARTSATNTSASGLYIDPDSHAARQAKAWRNNRPEDAALMDVLAAQPTANWFGDWNQNIYNDVHHVVSEAAGQNATPVLVAYNIPARDCGGYSAGGANSPSGYTAWMELFASAIGSNRVIVILEPDALAGMGCLNSQDQHTRLDLISSAVNRLKTNPAATVYIDAGHSGWIDSLKIASDLQEANIARADGFALNVSNFNSNDESINYGLQISDRLGSKHFVIDTSRNGNGSNGEWCNPSGRAIGTKPTFSTGSAMIDAFLWIKRPGESDGNCNGGPGAGRWWADYALQLILNAH
jgi:endoglucanase